MSLLYCAKVFLKKYSLFILSFVSATLTQSPKIFWEFQKEDTREKTRVAFLCLINEIEDYDWILFLGVMILIPFLKGSLNHIIQYMKNKATEMENLKMDHHENKVMYKFITICFNLCLCT
jgi:hypothetical protein